MKLSIVRVFLKKIIFHHFNFTLVTKINRKRVKIPIVKSIGFANIVDKEKWMVELLDKLLKVKEGSFIDIGVNVGQTLLKLKSVNAEIEYIGFEPNPSCLSYVDELIKKNNFNNCNMIPVGVFNENKIIKLDLYGADNSDAGASVIQNFRPNMIVHQSKYVPVFKFDTAVKDFSFDKISIIKVDVEGAELEVIKSLSATINSYRPIITVEILPVYNEENVDRLQRQEELEKFLNSVDYKILRVKKDDKGSFIGFERITLIGIHSMLENCDYVLSPVELEEQINN